MFKKKKPIPVCDLNLEKYMGVWYEIAKFPSRGQNGLSHVSAKYTLKNNGKVRVHNMGFKGKTKKQITGTAWLKNDSCKGSFNVRFFWPFKSDYIVIKIADDYRYAVVMGSNKSSAWILSRTEKMRTKDLREVIEYMNDHGFKTRKLVKTQQDSGLFR